MPLGQPYGDDAGLMYIEKTKHVGIYMPYKVNCE